MDDCIRGYSEKDDLALRRQRLVESGATDAAMVERTLEAIKTLNETIIDCEVTGIHMQMRHVIHIWMTNLQFIAGPFTKNGIEVSPNSNGDRA